MRSIVFMELPSVSMNGNVAAQLLVSELRRSGVVYVSTSVEILCDNLSTPMGSAVGNQKNGNCHRLESCAGLYRLPRRQGRKGRCIEPGADGDLSRQNSRPPLSGHAVALPPLRNGRGLGSDVGRHGLA